MFFSQIILIHLNVQRSVVSDPNGLEDLTCPITTTATSGSGLIVAAPTIDLNAMDFFEDEDSMDQGLHQLKMLNLGAWRQKCWSSITYCFPVSLLLTAGISSERELNPSLFSCLMRFRFNIPARSRLAFIPGISWISPSSLQSRAQSCKITFLQSECCHFELPDREKRSISTSLLSLL